jgi:hypothetical protein
MYMQTGLQAQIAFHLSGMRPGAELDVIDGLGLRPALLARYRDLDSLRYDYPLALIHERDGENGLQSLSGLIDAAWKEIASRSDGERLRGCASRMECEIRKLIDERSKGALSSLWEEAASRLGVHNDDRLRDSLARLRAAIKIDATILGCDKAAPFRLCHHGWKMAYEQKARHFREEIGLLVMKLADILRADFVHSPEGLSAEKLKACVGTSHRDAFDFDALSRLLTRTSSRESLSPSRRRRIGWLLSVLESQRFYPLLTEVEERLEPYGFVFESCADAIAAFRDRMPKMIELTQAIAMAELEIDGEYIELRHDPFFANYGVDGLDPRDFDVFPDYLILMHASDMGPADTENILEAFSAGMRAKVLVQTDDLLEPSAIAGGGIALGLRARQLANAAIGLSGFYVLQAPSSALLQFKSQIARGFAYPGPAVFSIFSGAVDNGLPPYLNAAAALESRAFPAFAYDPSAGTDWASRFDLSANPQPERDWPSYTLDYEDEAHQSVAEDCAFTLVDFVSCDKRYYRHFARVPRQKWSGSLTQVSDFLALNGSANSEKAPCLLMVDKNDVLQKVIADDKLLREARRCVEMWRSLQQLGGVHAARAPAAGGGVQEAETSEASVKRPEAVQSSTEPYIETARCSSCNECTRLNSKMFGYDENNQAYIKDPDAGTYRQLVEAAESCQLSIIHPGQPRNPDEPGLEQLRKRAESFM